MKTATYNVSSILKGRSKLVTKSLEYAVEVSFIDFDPTKVNLVTDEELHPRIVTVNGEVAIRLKGNIYTKF